MKERCMVKAKELSRTAITMKVVMLWIRLMDLDAYTTQLMGLIKKVPGTWVKRTPIGKSMGLRSEEVLKLMFSRNTRARLRQQEP